MVISVEATIEQRLHTARRLLEAAEQGYSIARQLREEVGRIRGWESGPRLTPLGYSLGISQEDATVGACRLGGLRNELEEIVQTLERQARQA